MSNKAISMAAAVILVLAGMAGLHLGIPFSGWVLATGLLGVFCS